MKKIPDDCCPLFITITLAPEMYVFKTQKQDQEVRPILKNIFGKNIDYYVILEYTKNKNCHYHALLFPNSKTMPKTDWVYYWKNKFRRSNNRKLCELGFTKIDRVPTHEAQHKCFKYMMKDYDLTLSIMKEDPLYINNYTYATPLISRISEDFNRYKIDDFLAKLKET